MAGHLLRRRVAVVLAAVVLALLTAVAVVRTRPVVERDLAARAGRALVLGGYRDVHVRYSGRDAAIAGVVHSEADRRRVAEIVHGRQGTRAVDVGRLLVDPGAPVARPVARPVAAAH